MPDVTVVAEWNRQVAELKDLAEKLGASFDLKMYPDGKEVVKVEQWYNPKENKK